MKDWQVAGTCRTFHDSLTARFACATVRSCAPPLCALAALCRAPPTAAARAALCRTAPCACTFHDSLTARFACATRAAAVCPRHTVPCAADRRPPRRTVPHCAVRRRPKLPTALRRCVPAPHSINNFIIPCAATRSRPAALSCAPPTPPRAAPHCAVRRRLCASAAYQQFHNTARSRASPRRAH